MRHKYLSTVTGASIYIALLGLISKSLGFLREVFFASIYGLSSDFDIYLIGAVIPLTFNIVIICLGQNYLIPSYNKINRIDKNQARNFIKINFYLFIFSGIILSSLIYMFAIPILEIFLTQLNISLFNAAKNVLYLFLISIPLTSGISVLIAYLQSNFEFKYSVSSQIFPNIIVLITVYFFKSLNIYAIPIGFMIGTILQLFLLLYKSKELCLLHFNFSNSFKLYKAIDITTVGIIVLIEILGQLYVVIDRYFYNNVPNGAISSLNYAQTIFQLPLLIISMALSTAIFPKFSQLLNQRLYSELENTFINAIKVNIIIFIPITFLFGFYGETILSLIFERGNFFNSSTIMTYRVLIYYSISLLFYSSYSVLNKIIYSADLIRELLFITLMGITLKIAFNFLLVGKYEHEGLAQSTSISYIFFFLSSIFLIYIKIKFNNRYFFVKESLHQLFNAIISIIIVKYISKMVPQNHIFILIEIVLFVLILIINLILLKNSFVNNLFQVAKNMISKRRCENKSMHLNH